MAVVGAGLVLPMWLWVLGFPSPPSIPFITVAMLIEHAVYGTILGAFFPFVEHV